MKKLHLFKTVLLLCALIVGSGNAWAQAAVNTVLWAEDFSGYSNNTAPSGDISNSHTGTTVYGSGSVTYECTDGGTTTQVKFDSQGPHTDANNANLLISKGNGNFTVSGISTGSATELTLSYEKSGQGTLSVSSSTTGVSISGSTITTNGASTITLIFTNTHATKNIRIDDISLIVKTAGSSKKATTTTIDHSGIAKTDRKGGTAAGSLSATVTVTETSAGVDGATVTWTSSDTSVATIASDGAVTLVGAGTTNLKATYDGDATYAGSNATYELTVTDSRADAELSFDEDSYTCDKFDSFATTLNTADGFDGTPVYESSDESVATVDSETGEVTIQGVGTTTISVTSAATDNFFAGSAQYELTVTIHDGVTPVNPSSTPARYVKVTSTADITNGDYLIVYESGSVAFDGGLGTLDGPSNTIAVTINEGVIASNSTTNAAVFTIDVTAGTIKSKSGYYIGVSSNSNGLKQTDDEDTYSHTFSIDGSRNAVIKADFESSTMYLNYNSDANQTRFRYYKNASQKAIQLYKYTPAITPSVTLSDKGYKTMVSSKPFSTEDATIYIVTANDGEKATMTSIEKAPANEPVILKGGANATVSLKEETTGSDVEDNKLEISTESTGNGVYVLAVKDDVVAFYEWNGGSLGTGRVYLPASGNEAREMIAFFFSDEETTGINTTLKTNERINNEVYNLNGQRVAQPTKGLYIVNGKKYIVK